MNYCVKLLTLINSIFVNLWQLWQHWTALSWSFQHRALSKREQNYFHFIKTKPKALSLENWELTINSTLAFSKFHIFSHYMFEFWNWLLKINFAKYFSRYFIMKLVSILNFDSFEIKFCPRICSTMFSLFTFRVSVLPPKTENSSAAAAQK